MSCLVYYVYKFEIILFVWEVYFFFIYVFDLVVTLY